MFDQLRRSWGVGFTTHKPKDFYGTMFVNLMNGLLYKLSHGDWSYILGNIKVRHHEIMEKKSLIEKGLIEEEV